GRRLTPEPPPPELPPSPSCVAKRDFSAICAKLGGFDAMLADEGTGPRLRVGELVADRFEIQRHSGTGGMGTVYRAWDRTLGQPVALKILRLRSDADRERFTREAQVLAGLVHPGVVRYVGHGTTAGGAWYLAMEWV